MSKTRPRCSNVSQEARGKTRCSTIVFLFLLLMLLLLLLSTQKRHAGQQEACCRGLRQCNSPTSSSLSLENRDTAGALSILCCFNEMPTPLRKGNSQLRTSAGELKRRWKLLLFHGQGNTIMKRCAGAKRATASELSIHNSCCCIVRAPGDKKLFLASMNLENSRHAPQAIAHLPRKREHDRKICARQNVLN